MYVYFLATVAYAFAIFLNEYHALTERSSAGHRGVKGKVSIYSTDKEKIPQNLMTKGAVPWMHKRLLHFTVYPKAYDEYYLADILADVVFEIQNHSCARFKYVETKVASLSETCYVPDYSRRQSDEVREQLFKSLFRCTGKQYEHRRDDRDSYVHILWTNVYPTYQSKFLIFTDGVTQGLPFDYNSIMQYRHNKYSKNEQSTIVPVNTSIPKEILGSARRPNEQDYLDINLSYCGTKTGMGKIRIHKIATTFILLTWGQPKYSPIRYKVRFQCSLLCEKRPYNRKEVVIGAEFKGVNLTELKTGSVCKVNILLIYNPSELDPGVDYVMETLQSKPTSPPKNLKILKTMDTSAELSWKPIPCCHRNGIIGHYLILYDYILPNGAMVELQSRTFMNVLDHTLVNLRPNTDYTVRVAGVNRAGRGATSLPVALITSGACPGTVYIDSINSTCNSVSIAWILPLDENRIPYDVRLKYTYPPVLPWQRPVTYRTIVSDATCRVVDLPSDVSVKFSFRAINKRGKKGPATYYTIKTKKKSAINMEGDETDENRFSDEDALISSV